MSKTVRGKKAVTKQLKEILEHIENDKSINGDSIEMVASSKKRLVAEVEEGEPDVEKMMRDESKGMMSLIGFVGASLVIYGLAGSFGINVEPIQAVGVVALILFIKRL